MLHHFGHAINGSNASWDRCISVPSTGQRESILHCATGVSATVQ